MNVEERVRVATRARTDLVRDIRPLELPARQPYQRPSRPGTRRWVSWGPRSPPPAWSWRWPSRWSWPARCGTSRRPHRPSPRPPPSRPPPASPATSPRSSQPAPWSSATPDAGTLAVLDQNLPETISGSPGPYTLRTYSLVTGQALRTWTTPDTTKNWAIATPNPDNAADLAWLAGGRTLAFRFPADTWPDDERTLSVTGKGTSLLAGSRPVLAVPGNDHGCTSVLLAANGQTTICGTAANSVRGCQQLEPEFDLYPVATGKPTSVLCRYRGTCQAANGILLWARSGSSAIAALEIIDETAAGKKGAAGAAATTVHFTVGLLTPGTFTPLHVVVPVRFGYLPGTIAF